MRWPFLACWSSGSTNTCKFCPGASWPWISSIAPARECISYVAPDDDHVCDVCEAAHGRVFLPSHVAKKHFSPLTGNCARPTPCNGVLLGLYGAWLEARGVLENLRKNVKKGGIQLSAEEVRALVSG